MQIFGRIAGKSAETMRLGKICSRGNCVEELVFYAVIPV